MESIIAAVIQLGLGFELGNKEAGLQSFGVLTVAIHRARWAWVSSLEAAGARLAVGRLE